MRVKRLLKDPLAHFIVAGIVLFILLSLARPVPQDDRIIVDRQALLSFIQYRNKAFEPALAASMLDRMSRDERERLVHDYLREEALYREALKLGLNAEDYVIRQRMVQKIEFLNEAVSAVPTPEPAELAAYYAEHRQEYYEPPRVTFTHVFIAFRGRTRELALHEARALLRTLNSENAGFADATRYGEHFLFHKNYVERAHEFIAGDFGSQAADVIFSGDSPVGEWFGPVVSEYGAHLIYISERAPGRYPSLTEVKPVIVEDYRRAALQAQKDALADAIVQSYSPVIKADIYQPAQEQTSAQ